ncbi:MAG: hypothetical protein AAGJ83_00120 [Planctomycetota bacterium]
MKISRAALATVMIAALSLVASDAMAQRGGGGRRGGGGPGGGGFGGPGGGGGPGGMMTMGRGGGASLVGLLRVEKVQEELDLEPIQLEGIEKLTAERAPRMERPEGFDFRDRSEENRAKMTELFEKARKQREEFDAKQAERLDEVLFPEQMERLKQIHVQVLGVQALMNARVAKELNLSASQKEELTETARSIQEDVREKMREMFQGGGGGDFREKAEEMRKEAEQKILGVLTSDQKTSFEKMKGEPFEMPTERGRFGGGQRGGAGGPGGRGGRGGERPGRGGPGGRPGGDGIDL